MTAIGLGSCICLVLHDRERNAGAMAHIMLPQSHGKTDRPGKYADTAIPLMLQELAALGCRKQSLVAKMAGGARMFEYFGTELNIGDRNAEKIRAILAELNIRLAAEEVGGKGGRTVTYIPSEGGKMVVKMGDGTTHEI